jgi:hypothetical protein
VALPSRKSATQSAREPTSEICQYCCVLRYLALRCAAVYLPVRHRRRGFSGVPPGFLLSRPRDKHWASNCNSSDSWPAGSPSYPVVSCSSRVRCTYQVIGLLAWSVESGTLRLKRKCLSPNLSVRVRTRMALYLLLNPSRSARSSLLDAVCIGQWFCPLVSAFHTVSHTFFASLSAPLASVVWGEELWRLFCHRAYIAILAPSRSIIRCFVRSVVRPLCVSQCTCRDQHSAIWHFSLLILISD